MDEKKRQSRSIRIKPEILKIAHIHAINSNKRLGEWLEEATEEEIERTKEA